MYTSCAILDTKCIHSFRVGRRKVFITENCIMESTPETDKTTLFFLSPRASSLCIICHSDTADSSNKQKLWKGNEKYAVN